MKMHLKISSAKWWLFCPGGDELMIIGGLRCSITTTMLLAGRYHGALNSCRYPFWGMVYIWHCSSYSNGYYFIPISEGSGYSIPDSKVHGANMGPIWVRQVPGGPHVGPMNFAILDGFMLWPSVTYCIYGVSMISQNMLNWLLPN